MILNGDVGLWLKGVPALSKVGREHQESDIVKQGGEFQVMQLAGSQSDRLSDQS